MQVGYFDFILKSACVFFFRTIFSPVGFMGIVCFSLFLKKTYGNYWLVNYGADTVSEAVETGDNFAFCERKGHRNDPVWTRPSLDMEIL